MPSLEQAILGGTYDSFKVTSVADNQAAVQHMLGQARHYLDIFSADLDPKVLNNKASSDLISALARRSRYSEIRLLINDPYALQSAHHCLIKLSQDLASYIKIKVLPNEYHGLPYCYYLVDDTGLIYRPLNSDFSSEIYFNAPLAVKEKKITFNELWGQSRLASEFRALNL